MDTESSPQAADPRPPSPDIRPSSDQDTDSSSPPAVATAPTPPPAAATDDRAVTPVTSRTNGVINHLQSIASVFNGNIAQLRNNRDGQQTLAERIRMDFSPASNATTRAPRRRVITQGGRGRRAPQLQLRIVCLRRPMTSVNNIDYANLSDYGLGVSRLETDENGITTVPLTWTAQDFREYIQRAFLPLEVIPYDVYRARRGGILEKVPSMDPTTIRQYLLQDRRRLNTNTTVYVVPNIEITHRPMGTPTIVARPRPQVAVPQVLPDLPPVELDRPITPPQDLPDLIQRPDTPPRVLPDLPPVESDTDRPDTHPRVHPDLSPVVTDRPETNPRVRQDIPLVETDRPVTAPSPMPDLPSYFPHRSDLWVPASAQARHITLRRDNVTEDVEQHFADDSVTADRVTVTIEGERAVDENGVFRDITTAYWSQVFDGTAFHGDIQAAPAPHPSNGPRFWKAMGNFLIAGFRQNGYLPVRFALASLIWAIFGEVSENMLMTTWMMVLGSRDRDVISTALRSGITDASRHSVICVLDIFRNGDLPSTSNIRSLCLRCARFCLIENSMFPLLSMGLHRLRRDIESIDVLRELYILLRPTADNIVDMCVPDNHIYWSCVLHFCL